MTLDDVRTEIESVIECVRDGSIYPGIAVIRLMGAVQMYAAERTFAVLREASEKETLS